MIRRIVQGDEAALAQLYDATHRRVFGMALRVLADEAEAEDVTVKVYTRVWERAGSFDSERGSVAGWMLAMTRSQSLDALRRRVRDAKRSAPESYAWEMPDPSVNPERNAAHSQRRAQIDDALARLNSDQRRVIEAAYFEGLSHREVAESFGLPLGTVKTRIRSGVAALRGAISSELRDELEGLV